MRLIDADDLKNTLRKTYRYCFNYKQYKRLQEEKQIIDNAPTVDAVPVVRCGEGKHREEKTFWCEKVQDFISNPDTNADRIRAMTDEELAEWYWWMLNYVRGATDSRTALLDWLKQEVSDAELD